MPKELTTNGDTSRIERVVLPDSSSTTGAGLTGLTGSSSGLIISTIADKEATAAAYTQAGSTIETIATLGTYAAPTATKCRFKEVDAANHPGLYEIQLADARYAVSNAEKLIITISGATNLAPTFAEIQLAKLDVYDSVRAGLTALPNAAADAAGGLPISDEGELDLDAIKAKTDTIGSGTVTVVSPIASDLSIEIIEGDDYVAADARAFEFTNVAGTWPDLTGATVTFTARHKSAGSNRFSVTGTVITPTGPNQQVSFDVSKATTDKLKEGKYDYIVAATLASGNIVTLVRSADNFLTLKSDLVQG